MHTPPPREKPPKSTPVEEDSLTLSLFITEIENEAMDAQQLYVLEENLNPPPACENEDSNC